MKPNPKPHEIPVPDGCLAQSVFGAIVAFAAGIALIAILIV